MLKKVSVVALLVMLSACSSWKNYVPFVGDDKSVINLEQDRIDQKSYAVAYQATVQTYKDRVAENYLADDFARGANDWLMGRVSLPLAQIKENLYSAKGQQTKTFTYYSGVVFAGDLQANFSRLSAGCWQNIDRASLSQGIYDAMLDLKKGKVRSENDEYLAKGSDQLLNTCQAAEQPKQNKKSPAKKMNSASKVRTKK